MPSPESTLWRAILRERQNEDGGFPYFQGNASALEPTALAVLALQAADPEPGTGRPAAARRYLAALQTPAGAWPAAPGEDAAAWETPLVLLALAQDAGYAARCRAGLQAYLRVRADAPNPEGVTVDPRWRGWNWYPPTPGWVEPTSLALIAAQRLSDLANPSELQPRLEDGRAFLLDRMTPDGGWNYGNSYVLGVAVSPFLAPTAMALLALQQLAADDPRLARAADLLEDGIVERPSGWTLAWGILALLAYGRSAGRPRELLRAVWRESAFLDNVAVVALALLASECDAAHPLRPPWPRTVTG